MVGTSVFLNKASAVVKQSKWLLYVFFAVGLALLVLAVRRLFSTPSDPLPKRDDGTYLPPVPTVIQAAVDRAEEEAQKAKAIAKAVTEEKQKQLDSVLKIQDGKERRKRLAELAQTL